MKNRGTKNQNLGKDDKNGALKTNCDEGIILYCNYTTTIYAIYDIFFAMILSLSNKKYFTCWLLFSCCQE